MFFVLILPFCCVIIISNDNFLLDLVIGNDYFHNFAERSLKQKGG